MHNFEYYSPTRIVFGEGSIPRLADLVPADARVLVLYGGGSAERNGTLAEVTAALGARTVHRFGGIEPNPTYETLMNAVAQVRRDNIDFLLAVGGVPMAALLGILTGLLAFLPNIGAIVSGILLVLVGFSAGVETGLWAIGVYFVVQTVDGYLIVPTVAKRSVDLAPALVLGALGAASAAVPLP